MEEDSEVTAKLNAGSLYAPKTLCAISRAPIYGALRQFLTHLYRTAAAASNSSIQTSITAAAAEGDRKQLLAAGNEPLWQLSVSVRMFVDCLPMPLPGGRAFQVR